MTMNILVLTDFSNDAYNALHYATQIFGHRNCTFHIAHQYDEFSSFKPEYDGPYKKEEMLTYFRKRSLDCLEETKHRIIRDTEENSLHHFEIVAMNDDLIGGTKDFIEQKKIDVLVMGNRGRTGVEEMLFGGNTTAMIRSDMECPLLCVPRQHEFTAPKNLAYATDFRRPVDYVAMKNAKELALAHQSVLHIIHVSEEDELEPYQWKNKVFLEDFLEGATLKFHTLPYTLSKARTISKFAEENDIDLLLLNYYRHTIFESLTREPVVVDLGMTLNIPFLVLHEEA